MKRIIIGVIIGLLLSSGIAYASTQAAIIPLNDRQNITRYYDEQSGVVCYMMVNKTFTWVYDLSCLSVDQVKDLP